MRTRHPQYPFHRTIAAAALVFGLAAALAAQGEPAKAGGSGPRPRLVVPEKVHTTEELARDGVAEHTFLLRNEGDAPLELQFLVSTANIRLSERTMTLAPGTERGLTVSVPLLGEPPGGLLKQIEIRGNDPDQVSVVLELKIQSVEYVRPNPPRARWISVQQEMDGKLVSVLRSTDGTPFRIVGLSEPPAGMSYAFRPAPDQPDDTPLAIAPPPGTSRNWQVEMTLTKSAPVGAITGRLEVEVDHPKQRIVPIPLSGFMRPVIAVTPHELKLGELAAGGVTTLDFYFRNFATEPIHLAKVEPEVPGLGEAAIQVEELGRKYRVRIPVDFSQQKPGALRGAIRFHTDSAKVPVYTVPFEAVIAAP